MNYDGKTYRNLEGQVAYLTEVAEALDERITEVAAQIPSKMIVEELPEEGDPLITYYVGPKGTAPNYYYEVWVWVQEEPDGPFVWRELEDTDQVDLSGYLQKVETATTYPQIYAKATDGSQTMVNAANSVLAYSAVLRDANGQLTVPDTPTANGHATSKKYVDDNFVAQVKTQGGYARRIYAVLNDGDGVVQTTLNVSSSPDTSVVVYRATNGQLSLPDQSQSAPSTDQAISKRFGDSTYLAKQTGTSTNGQLYAKTNGGSQAMVDVGSSVIGNMVVARNGNGQILVPTTPTDNSHAASKKYVDDAVGQLLYLHEIDLVYTIDASTSLGVKCHLISDDSTAITTLDRTTFRLVNVAYGALNPDLSSTVACAVTKFADGFRQNEFEEAYPGFLYQYYSGGVLTSGNTFGLTPTVTDAVISF